MANMNPLFALSVLYNWLNASVLNLAGSNKFYPFHKSSCTKNSPNGNQRLKCRINTIRSLCRIIEK